MECAPVPNLPEGSDSTYEIKLDGYRASGVKTNRETIRYSRNHTNRKTTSAAGWNASENVVLTAEQSSSFAEVGLEAQHLQSSRQSEDTLGRN